MQDRLPPDRRKPLATRGRTIHSGQSRRFCDVCFSVRYPQYRTFTSDWDWPACRLAAPELQTTGQPRQLRRSALDRLRDMSCTCGRQRPGISTAPNPRGSCSRHACPGFCPMAVWRTIAQDRRGADNRPLDSRIKGQGAPWSIFRQCRSLSQFFWHLRTLQESGFSFALKRSVQCAAETDLAWRC
jgi:hypothetical protein